MWGSATLAMEVSSTSIKAARATVMAMNQGLTRGFQFACGKRSGEKSGLTADAGGSFAPVIPRPPAIAEPDGGAGSVVSAADNSRLLTIDCAGNVPWPGKTAQ